MNVFPFAFLLLPAFIALAIVLIMLDTVWFPEARRKEADDAPLPHSAVRRVLPLVKRLLAWLLFVPSVLFLVFVGTVGIVALWRS